MKLYGEKSDFDKIYKSQDLPETSVLINNHRNDRKRFLDCLAKYAKNNPANPA